MRVRLPRGSEVPPCSQRSWCFAGCCSTRQVGSAARAFEQIDEAWELKLRRGLFERRVQFEPASPRHPHIANHARISSEKSTLTKPRIDGNVCSGRRAERMTARRPCRRSGPCPRLRLREVGSASKWQRTIADAARRRHRTKVLRPHAPQCTLFCSDTLSLDLGLMDVLRVLIAHSHSSSGLFCENDFISCPVLVSLAQDPADNSPEQVAGIAVNRAFGGPTHSQRQRSSPTG